MVLVTMDSQFTIDMPWLSLMVDKRELLAPWWDNIEDKNVSVSFTLFSRYSLFQGNICGYKEEIAFSENSLALNANGQAAE